MTGGLNVTSDRHRNGPAAALILALLSLVACSGGPKPPNVILVTIDTMRPDHMGCEGYEGARTPNLDAFAASGFHFLRCTTPVPITLPAHTSILTGTTPLYHGVHDNTVYKVAPSNLTLAEILSESGYDTAGFISGVPLIREFQIDQGFAKYDDDLEVDDLYSWSPGRGSDGATQMEERKADATTAAAIRWLREEAREPFFLWVHYFDPHQSYDPPPPYGDLFYDRPYDGEIAFVDEQFGRLLAAVDDEDMSRRTSVVVTGDHGEGLGEHGELTHAMLTYDSTLRVPLIMQLVGEDSGGDRLTDEVQLTDIAPTILDHVGLEVPAVMQGVSLVPRLRENRSIRDRCTSRLRRVSTCSAGRRSTV